MGMLVNMLRFFREFDQAFPGGLVFSVGDEDFAAAGDVGDEIFAARNW